MSISVQYFNPHGICKQQIKNNLGRFVRDVHTWSTQEPCNCINECL